MTIVRNRKSPDAHTFGDFSLLTRIVSTLLYS